MRFLLLAAAATALLAGGAAATLAVSGNSLALARLDDEHAAVGRPGPDHRGRLRPV